MDDGKQRFQPGTNRQQGFQVQQKNAAYDKGWRT